MNPALRQSIWDRRLLPAGARWVEYLGGTGTQWIDTGVIPNSLSSREMHIRASYHGGNEPACLLGSCVPGPTYQPFYYQINKTPTANQFRLITAGNGDAFYYLNDAQEFHDYKLVGNLLYLDNSLVCEGLGSGTSSYVPSTLFYARRNFDGTVVQQGNWWIAKSTILDSGVALRDFRPIAIGTTGYMLDLLTGEYEQYGNGGTGDFVIGPSRSAPAA